MLLNDLSHPAIVSSGLVPQYLSSLAYPTPYLLMDLRMVESSYRRFHEVLPGVHLHYAMKCNSDRRLLKCINRLGGGFEIASYAELEMLMAIGVDPATVIFSNPVKGLDHIARAAGAGVWRFAFDSRAELEKIARYALGASVYVRLEVANNDSMVPSEGKFGIAPDLAEQLLREAGSLGLRSYGISFHVGSQKLTPQAWRDAIKDSAGIMRRLEKSGIKLSMLNIGGGFAVHYSDHTPDLAYFGQFINKALVEFLPYPVDLVAEPGRGLVAEAGVMVATIIGTAERRGRRWLHLDVGAFNGFMESLESGNQLLFPLADELDSPSKQTYHVTGPSCDSQDTLLFDVALSKGLKIGQKVFIYSAGAYTTSYASHFNGFDIPKTRYVAQK